MSTVYLFDAHNNVLANSAFNEVRNLTGSEPESAKVVNGNFVIRVPFDVSASGSNINDLVTSKFAGLLANYPGFANITYDDGLDATGIDTVNTSGGTVGSRGTVSVFPGGQFQTSMAGLSATPNDAIVIWEVFSLTVADPVDGPLIKSYEEQDPSAFTVEVSFNNGLNFQTVVYGALFSIAPAQQGNQFILRATNPGANRQWLGSWAVIY